MATIITLQSSDQISSSRADINTSLVNLNADKIETSYIDTDTAMAANSDTKIPSQKAVKTYIDTQGGANASETVRGIVEEATTAEVTAGTDTGATGAKLFVPPSKLNTQIAALTPSQALVSGPIPNSTVKTHFVTQLLFTLWTGATSGAATTDFTNWTRTDSTKIPINNLGTIAAFASTGTAQLTLLTPFWNSGSTQMDYGSSTQNVILDFWMKYTSGTGEAMMGFFDTPSGLYGDNQTGVGFHIANGVIYTLTQKADPNGQEERTDISSGLTITNWNNYRIEFDMGPTASTARFYVNGTLKKTTTGTAQASDSMPVAATSYVGFGRHVTNPVLFSLTAPYFAVQMNS